MNEGGTALVVENDEDLGTPLYDRLSAEGYEVRISRSGVAAFEHTRALCPDLIVIDLGLPAHDAARLCRRFRVAAPNTVIVAISAGRDEDHIVLALDAGADDLLTKPVSLQELIARIQAHRRRRHRQRPDDEFRVGTLRVRSSTRRAFVVEAPLALRPREYQLLKTLIQSAGHVCTREQLMNDVWPSNYSASTKTLDVHIASLRRRLAEAKWEGRITTLPRVGYRLESIEEPPL